MGQHQSEHQKSVALSLSLRAGTAVHNTSRQSSVLCFSCCKTANFAHVPRLPPRPARAYFSQFAAVADRSFLRVTRNSVCQNGQTDSKAPIQRERERETNCALHSEKPDEGRRPRREGRKDAFVSLHGRRYTQALGTQHMCCHLILLGLVQCKPGLTNWACPGQAQAELDGSTCEVDPAPNSRQRCHDLTTSRSIRWC